MLRLLRVAWRGVQVEVRCGVPVVPGIAGCDVRGACRSYDLVAPRPAPLRGDWSQLSVSNQEERRCSDLLYISFRNGLVMMWLRFASRARRGRFDTMLDVSLTVQLIGLELGGQPRLASSASCPRRRVLSVASSAS